MPSSERTERTDRARGTLLGLAWGDVLGCPVEGWREVDIARHFGTYETLPREYPPTVAELPARRQRRLRPLGLHSDDTQQALALLGTVLDPAGWSDAAWAEWLVAGAEADAWRGTGSNFDAAVAALRQGVAPQHSGSSSAGIGAAMRVGPLGAAFADDPDRLAVVVMEASLTTHRDLRATAVAYAVAETVRGLVRGQQPVEVLDRLSAQVRAVEDAWRERAGSGAQAGNGHAHLRARAPAHPNQGFALLGGIHGLLAGLWDEPSPAERLAAVIANGGDADTVGAICGTVLGARYDDGWIPTDRMIDAARLRRWADALADGGPPPEDRAAFLRREAELTAWERDFQRQQRDRLNAAGTRSTGSSAPPR